MVSISGMAVSSKTELRFPITGQPGHGSRNIQPFNFASKGCTGVYVHLGRGVRITNTANIPKSKNRTKRKPSKWIFPLQELFLHYFQP